MVILVLKLMVPAGRAAVLACPGSPEAFSFLLQAPDRQIPLPRAVPSLPGMRDKELDRRRVRKITDARSMESRCCKINFISSAVVWRKIILMI